MLTQTVRHNAVQTASTSATPHAVGSRTPTVRHNAVQTTRSTNASARRNVLAYLEEQAWKRDFLVRDARKGPSAVAYDAEIGRVLVRGW